MKKRSALISGVLLLLIVLLALALRVYRLGAQSLWYDEGFSVYLARMSLTDITAHTAADIQPPLYYYLLHAWIKLLGESETTLRLLSLLFGVLTVPLAYAVAWQLFRSRLAGLLAAFLMAVSPLHVWYAQEVRMYTLLTFLCLLSSYFLLLIVQRTSPSASAEGEEESRPWPTVQEILLWFGYALTSIAALYTHYFAFFVLAFQGVYLLLVWAARRFGPPRLILGGIASGLTIVLAYLPWLPNLLTRYGTDASYWPGQLKLGEVFVDIAVFYVGGESIDEFTGLLLGAAYGLILLLCLVALLHYALRSRSAAASQSRTSDLQFPVSFLLLYLLLPTGLILLLSYNDPKFNARYVLVSHPALLFILAGGLAVLWQWRKGIVGNLFRGALATAALLFAVGAAGYADYQTYAARDFARADYRGVARYISGHIAPDEAVILCSGHMYPVFDFYAPGVERHLLPDSPTLDTTRTLDYSIASDLNRWLGAKGGVWVVLWQDNVVDPVGYLTTMLSTVAEEQPVPDRFAQLELRHYRLPANVQFSDQPVIAHPFNLNFGNQLRLLGYSQTGPQQVTLFWEAQQPLVEDYLVSLVLRDTNNQAWGRLDCRPTDYEYPTDRWRVGQVIPGRYDLGPLPDPSSDACSLALMPGTPPGDYGLDVGVYTEDNLAGLDLLDEAGAPQGKRAMLGAVRLSVPAVSAGDIDIANQLQASIGGGLSLLGWDLDRSEAQPGDRLLLTLAWSVESPPEGDYRVRLLVTDVTSQTYEAGTFQPTNAWHPTGIWQPGQAWLGQSTFRLPIQAQPGDARLSVQLLNPGGAELGPPVEVTTLRVLPTTRSFTEPQPRFLRQADFGGKIELVGADLATGPFHPGEAVRITLHWQATADMDIPYTVFVHLLGTDGRVVSGNDGQPVGGTRPTTGWVPGEFIADPRELPIPQDLAPGYYVVEVGLYDAEAPGMPRLSIVDDKGKSGADRVIFGPVEVR